MSWGGQDKTEITKGAEFWVGNSKCILKSKEDGKMYKIHVTLNVLEIKEK